MVLGLGMWEVRAGVIRVPLLMVLVLYKWRACPPPAPIVEELRVTAERAAQMSHTPRNPAS